MRERPAGRLAWSLWALYLVGSAVTVWFALIGTDPEPIADGALFILVYGVFATVGALVASRRPDNAIGWILLAIGLGTTWGNATQGYALYTLESGSRGSGSSVALIAWLGAWLWPMSVTLLVFLLLLFPTGRPTSARWKPAVWLAAAGWTLLAAAEFWFKPGNLDISESPIDNPLGIKAAEGLLETLAMLGGTLVSVMVVVALISLGIRARRSRGEERQQLKWFAYAGFFLFFDLFIFNNLVATFAPALNDTIGNVSFALGIVATPLAIGVSILRYRLYDIDLIINRTLVYGALTALLVLLYVGIVFTLQSLLPEDAARSNLTVAGSTLAVAGLFSPLRTRVQTFIDHSFYRRKYDAQQTIESFSARLRDEVDLDSLRQHLLEVVDETMQPAKLSLWLRTAEPSKEGHG